MVFIALAGRAQKRGGAGFCSNKRRHYGPPGDVASAQGEIMQRVFAPTNIEADSNNAKEINKDDETVDNNSGGGQGRSTLKGMVWPVSWPIKRQATGEER